MPEPSKRESIHFIFDAGILDVGQIARIDIPPAELAVYRLLVPEDALPLLDIHLRRRMAYVLRALEDGGTYYLEDGCAL